MAKSRARKLADIIVGAGIDIDGNLTFDGGSTSADLTFADNDKANFGDASDLQIYHDGSNSWIKDTGTGSLLLTGSTGVFIRGANNENSIQALEDGAVNLYYDGNKKFETTSTGVKVTGNLTADDNQSILLGTGSDLRIKHDGTNSIISDEGGGDLIFKAYDDFYFKQVTDDANILRLNTGGDATFYGHVSLADDKQLKLGDSNELVIYHTASGNSIISEAGGGSLYLDGTNIYLRKSTASGETMGAFVADGAATLYYDNSAKLATFSGGVSVTGQLNATTMHLPDGSTGLQLGASNDTKFFHDGSNSKITHSGSGGFYIGADTLGLQTGAHNENYLTAAANGAVSLYYDNSAKLATASTGIDVTGSIDVTSSASYGVTANRGFKSTADIPNFTLVESDASGQTWQINSTGAKLSFRDISRQLDRIVIDTAGRVGIGTTSPGTKLAVKGTASFIATNSTNNWMAYTYTDNTFRLNYNGAGADEVIIDSSGNVGIGVASLVSGDKLTLNGNFNLNGTLFNGTSNNSAGINFTSNFVNHYGYAGIRFYAQAAGIGSMAERMRIDSNGNVGIGESNPSDTLEISGGNIVNPNSTGSEITSATFGIGQNIHLEERQVNGAYSDRTDLAIVTNTGFGLGESEKIRIEAGGNVGIGTTAPVSLLHIKGSGTYNHTPANPQGADFVVTSSEMSDNNAHSIMQLVSVRQSLTTGSGSTGYLGFSTMDDSNNAGINDAARIAIVNEAGSSVTSATALSFWTNAGGSSTGAATERMRIDSSGNVGIGTSSPTSTLDLTKTSDAGERAIRIENSSARLYVGVEGSSGNRFVSSSTNNAFIGTTTDDGLELATANAVRAIITNGGNVGIGVTDPDVKLEVSGSARFAQENHAWTFDDTNNNRLGFVKQSGSYSMLASAANTPIIFATSNNSNLQSSVSGQTLYERMRVNYNGNVGIGTSSPDERLHVTGGGIKVDGEPTIATNSGAGLFFGYGSNVAKITALDQGVAWKNLRLNAAEHEFYIAGGLQARIDGSGNFLMGAATTNDTSASMGGQTPDLYVPGYTSLGGLRIKGTDTGNTLYKTGGAFGLTVGDSSMITLSNSNSTARLSAGNWEVLSGGQLRAYRGGNSAYGALYMDTAENLFIYNSWGAKSIVLDRDGKVGIGTSDPAVKMHIVDSDGEGLRLENTTAAPTNSVSNAPHLEFFGRGWDSNYGSKPIKARIEHTATYGDYGYGATQGALVFSVQGAGGINSAPDTMQEGMRIAAGSDDLNHPRVGIGEGNPGAQLQIQNGSQIGMRFDTNSKSLIRLLNNTIGLGERTDLGIGFSAISAYGGTYPLSGITGGWDDDTSGGLLSFRTSTDGGTTWPSRMVIKHDGKVGIGTSNPTSALVVQGEGSGGSKKNTIAFGTSGWGSPTAPNAALDGGVKLALFEGGTQKVQIGMDANARLWLMSAGSGAQGVDIYTGASNTAAPTLRFRVDQGGTTNIYGNLSLSSNLGIGTSSPSEDLHIYRTSGNADAKLQAAAAGSDSRLFISRNGSSSRAYVNYSDVVSGANWYTGLLRNTTNIFAIGQGDDFGTNTRLCIDNGGNVGIGTTNPSSKLEVNNPSGAGNGSAQEVARFVNTASGATSMYLYLGASTGTDWRLGKNVSGIANNINFSIADNGGTRKFDLTPDGTVGIGTTTPITPSHKTSTVTAAQSTSNGWSISTSGVYSARGAIEVAGITNRHIGKFGLSGNFSANTWYPIVKRDDLISMAGNTESDLNGGFGVYFRIYAYTSSIGGGEYLANRVTETVWVTHYGSNSNQTHEMRVGAGFGHAPNTGHDADDPSLCPIRMRIAHHYGSDTTWGNQQTFELNLDYALTGADPAAAGKQLIVYAYMI